MIKIDLLNPPDADSLPWGGPDPSAYEGNRWRVIVQTGPGEYFESGDVFELFARSSGVWYIRGGVKIEDLAHGREPNLQHAKQRALDVLVALKRPL